MPSNKKTVIGARGEENPEIPAFHNENLRSISYEICIQGQVSPQWFDNFDGLSFQDIEKSQTLIQATLIDKSALFGLLTRIGELNLTVLSINKIGGSFRSNKT